MESHVVSATEGEGGQRVGSSLAARGLTARRRRASLQGGGQGGTGGARRSELGPGVGKPESEMCRMHGNLPILPPGRLLAWRGGRVSSSLG